MQRTMKSAISFLLAIGIVFAMAITVIPNQAQAAKGKTVPIAVVKRTNYRSDKKAGSIVKYYATKNSTFKKAKYEGKKNGYEWYSIKKGGKKYYLIGKDVKKLINLGANGKEVYYKDGSKIVSRGDRIKNTYYYKTGKKVKFKKTTFDQIVLYFNGLTKKPTTVYIKK